MINKHIKKDIIRLLIAAAFFAGAILSQKILVSMDIIDKESIWLLPMYLVPYIIAGYKVIAEAAEHIVHGQIFDENFLMLTASVGALCIGEYPEAVAVMILFSVGEIFEHIAVEKSRKSISDLMDIKPEYAFVLRSGKYEKVKPEEVKIGEIILVKPGEKIALDGVIIDGESALNTVAITGESLPRDVKKGSEVYSGCINMSAPVKIKVSSDYENSTVGKILELIEDSAESKAQSETFIRKFAKVYTPVVVLGAVALAVLPPLLGMLFKMNFYTSASAIEVWGDWLHRALTFLVVSCPCALVISVPLSFFAGIGAASKQGMLIKGSNYLESLSKVRSVAFDKTGTLTKGDFSVVAIHPNKVSEEELLEIACHAEIYSNHPISDALRAAYEKTAEEKRVSNIVEIAGKGISARIDGKITFVGNASYMGMMEIEYKECSHKGTIVHIALDGEYLGHIVISDSIKADSRMAVSDLRGLGINTYMLTGDRESAAKEVAEKLKVDKYFASLLPADKVEIIKKLKGELKGGEKIAFVGDGVNDAPVLGVADVGMAMGALGSDAAIESADVVLMDDKPSGIAKLIKHAKRTKRIVSENIAFSLAVKLAVLVLSAFGVAHMMYFAVFADVGVMIIAVMNAMRCLKFKK